MTALTAVLARADHCHGIVTRDGEQDACGKPPVAIIDGRDTEAEGYWPACAYHANRYGDGRCVPIAGLVSAVHASLAEKAQSPTMRGRLLEVLLTEHIDGDYLIGCGRSVGNEGGDVAIHDARPSEAALWAAQATAAFLAALEATP